MIIIDTNLLSEEMKQEPKPLVHKWFLSQVSEHLYTTSICQAEILAGISVLPDGKRKTLLFEAAENIFGLFQGRILSFDSNAAKNYAEIISQRQAKGRPIDSFDAQIASIAKTVDMALATRNVKDFEYTGVKIINPWDE